MEELSEFELGVIPDEIEPRVGYKYLRVASDGSMYSPQQSMYWPSMEKAVAEGCEHWVWEPFVRHPPGRQFQEWFSVDDLGSSPTMPIPLVELPDGLEWYAVLTWHEAPGERCSCGIYAVDLPSMCDNYRGTDCVLVEVAVWGKVVPASQGMRGQFAYPKAIYAERGNLRKAQKAAALYRVPLIAASKQEEDEGESFPQAAPMRIELGTRHDGASGFLAAVFLVAALAVAVVSVLTATPILVINVTVFLFFGILLFISYIKS